MKTKKMLFISNILNTVKVILFAILTILLLISVIMMDYLMDESTQLIEEAVGHDLTGAYEMIVGVFGGIFGFFAVIILVVLTIIVLVMTLFYLLSLIYSIVVYNKSFKQKYKPLKNTVRFLKSDCIQKIVIASIELIAIIVLFFLDSDVFIIGGILFCINVTYIILISYILKTISSEKLELETYVRS